MQADFDATLDGQHTILVSELGDDGTASYHLSLSCLFGPCKPPITDGALDHYKCYTVTPAKGAQKFEARDVMLEDQFEGKNTTVVKPLTICNPVAKNGEEISNATDHLVCYDIRDVKGQDRFPKRDVEIANQFDEDPPLKLTVTKSDFVCVRPRRAS